VKANCCKNIQTVKLKRGTSDLKLLEINEPLSHAIFKRRINRFLVELTINEKRILAHLGNSGRLEDLLVTDAPVLIRKVDKPKKRKTSYDIIAVQYSNFWVLVDSKFHTIITSKLLSLGLINDLKGYKISRKEFKIDNVRIDFLLEKNNEKCLLEVKGCTLVKKRIALFPDAPTERGRRQLELLAGTIKKNYRAIILFLVLREDADMFSPNWSVDPDFSEKLKLAYNVGVKVLAYMVTFDGKTIGFRKEIPVVI